MCNAQLHSFMGHNGRHNFESPLTFYVQFIFLKLVVVVLVDVVVCVH